MPRTNDWQPVYIWLAAGLYAFVAMQLCSDVIKVEQVLKELAGH